METIHEVEQERNDFERDLEALRSAGRAVIVAALPGSVQHVPECGSTNAACAGCRLRMALAELAVTIGVIPDPKP